MNPANISVIIPAFNAARYLADALLSVQAQTRPAREVIVVDNASTDATREIALRHGTRCEYEPRQGAASARNRGISLATGDYFAFLDADDLWVPRKLEWQMEALDQQPELEAVFGGIEHFISPDLPPAEAARVYCPPGALPVRQPNLMLIRRRAFERVGPFLQSFPLGEVVEWFVRAEAAGLRFITLPQVLTRRRLHADNQGRRLVAHRSDYTRLIKQKLDLERAGKSAPEIP